MSEDYTRIRSGLKLLVSVSNILPDRMVSVMFADVIFPEKETVIINHKDFEWFCEQARQHGLAVSDTGEKVNENPVYDITEARIDL